MIALFAQSNIDASSSWGAVLALGVLAMLAVNAITIIRGVSGKGTERQVEPTQIAAIQHDMKTMAEGIASLATTQAAQGEAIKSIKETVEHVRQTQQRDVEGLYRRVNSISEDLAGVKERVGAIERQCPKC